MTSTKFFNLTDVSRVTKFDKGNPFPAALKSAQDSQVKFEKRLADDPTKTAMEKTRLGYQHATKTISGLIKNLDDQTKPRQEKNTNYKRRVTGWLDENSTTNMMIMNSVYSALKDWKPSELMKASRDDRNVSKMILTTPAGKYGYELSDTQKQQFFDDAVKHTLGNDLDDFNINKQVLDALNDASEHLLEDLIRMDGALETINARVVDEVA